MYGLLDAQPSVVGVPSPAAGGGFSYLVPGSERQLILAVTFQLVTAAAAASRLVYLDLTDGTGAVIARAHNGNVQTAGLTWRYTFAVGIDAYGGAATTSQGIPLVPLPLDQGCGLAVGIGSVQAADQVSLIRLALMQAPVRDE